MRASASSRAGALRHAQRLVIGFDGVVHLRHAIEGVRQRQVFFQGGVNLAGLHEHLDQMGADCDVHGRQAEHLAIDADGLTQPATRYIGFGDNHIFGDGVIEATLGHEYFRQAQVQRQIAGGQRDGMVAFFAGRQEHLAA